MSSSTSSSEPRRRWVDALVFIVVFLALWTPNEVMVRRSEAVYGKDPVMFKPPLGDNAKLDAFAAEVRAGHHFDMFIVGSSVAEYGLHPDVLAEALPADKEGVYNLGFSGTSALTGLEILRRLGIQPAVLVVSVHPFDFTDASVERGVKILQYGESSKALLPDDRTPPSFDVRKVLEDWTRARVWSVFHSATPARHRILPEWIAFWPTWRTEGYSTGTLLRFFNNAEAATDDKTWANLRYYVEFCKHGYLGLKLRWKLDDAKWDAEAYKPILDDTESRIVPGYRKGRDAYTARMREALLKLRVQGTTVYLVRLPQYGALDVRQDALLPFDDDMRRLAGEVGATYVPATIVPPAFHDDRGNFRDAEHLHYESSITYGKMLVPLMR